MLSVKKTEKANLENRRLLFTEIGLVAALLLVWGAFSYTSREKKTAMFDDINQELIEAITKRMHEMTDAATPINKDSFPLTEAMKIFEEQNMPDKMRTCYFRRSRVINLYEIDGYFDYFYGYMLPNMGMVKYFDVLQFRGGFILNLPTKQEPEIVP